MFLKWIKVRNGVAGGINVVSKKLFGISLDNSLAYAFADAAASSGAKTVLRGTDLRGSVKATFENRKEFIQSRISKLEESGIKGAGNSIQYAETGGRNIFPERFFEEEAIAEEMHEKFRDLGTEDVNAIAKNTGFSVARMQRIKDHVFNNSHIKDHEVGRFDPDYELAQLWERLTDGRQVDSDIQLLHHEIFETKFEGIFQTNYRTAHDKIIEFGRPWNWEENYEE